MEEMNLDLLTVLANEFEIPIICQSQKVWFFRTKAGRFYNDFRKNSFIALGWDLISPDLITDNKKSKDAKKERIENIYPDEKRPGLIFGQMDVFYNQMKPGDLVIIPGEGSKEISIGRLGELAESVVRRFDNEDYPQCTYIHKRNVEWLKQVDAWQDIYLFKALRAQQTISDITEDAKLVFRNLFPIYISDNLIHLTLQKPT
jgi:predicted Mrr-cat superfamily restriction endonuclease